jgi:hypothetical protein
LRRSGFGKLVSSTNDVVGVRSFSVRASIGASSIIAEFIEQILSRQ